MVPAQQSSHIFCESCLRSLVGLSRIFPMNHRRIDIYEGSRVWMVTAFFGRNGAMKEL